MSIQSSLAGSSDFIISESLKSAWKIFKKNWIIVYTVQLLPVLFGIVYSILVSGIDENSPISAAASLIYMVIQLIVSMGVIKAYLSITRGEKVNMQTFTEVMPKAAKFLLAQALLAVIIVGGFILLIVPGIYFSIKYMFAPYLVIDKGLGPIEALKASGKMTKGVKWDVLGFLAAVCALTYSGIFVLFVGLIVTIPVGTLAYVTFYNRLVKRI